MSQLYFHQSFRVLLLSATSARSGLKVFDHSPATDAAESEEFHRIFNAPKHLVLDEVESRAVESTFFRLATENPPRRTVVFIEQPEKAAAFAKRLAKDSVALLTGTMRGLERDGLAADRVFTQFLRRDPPPEPVWLVATSAAEVGVNLTCERLVTGLVEADHLIQRFGRLNRFGEGKGEAHVVYAAEKDERRLRTLEYQRRLKTLEYLRGLGGDISCARIWAQQPPAEARSEEPRFARLEGRLIETWAQTTYKDSAMTPVAPWLHGQEADVPETELAWRADVSVLESWRIENERIEEILERYPVRPHERLREPSRRVLEKLSKLAEGLGEEAKKTRVIVIDSDGSAAVQTLPELLEAGDIRYKLLILPDRCGALDRGMFRPEFRAEADGLDVADQNSSRRRYLIQGSSWTPVGNPDQAESFEEPSDRESLALFARARGLRAPLVIREPEGTRLLVYFAEAAEKRRELRDVLLGVTGGAPIGGGGERAASGGVQRVGGAGREVRKGGIAARQRQAP